MVTAARAKLATHASFAAAVVGAEELERLETPPLDGAFSNFAALNCVSDLTPVARGLASLVRPCAPAIIVVFGIVVPGDVLLQLVRRDFRAIFRRAARGDVHARLGGHEFVIRYHRPRAIVDAFRPWFRLVDRKGVGVFVPPSAAEPWISRHARLLSLLERLERGTSRAFAGLGDHVLYRFERR